MKGTKPTFLRVEFLLLVETRFVPGWLIQDSRAPFLFFLSIWANLLVESFMEGVGKT